MSGATHGGTEWPLPQPELSTEASKCVQEPLDRVAVDTNSSKARMEEVESRIKAFAGAITTQTAAAQQALTDFQGMSPRLQRHSLSTASYNMFTGCTLLLCMPNGCRVLSAEVCTLAFSVSAGDQIPALELAYAALIHDMEALMATML